MPIVLEDVDFDYVDAAGRRTGALRGVTLAVGDAEFVAVAGATGSGKSTLIQLMGGLLQPTRGRVYVDGQDLRERRALRAVRGRVGVVFQFPEDQLFGETVFEDVAFGPRNLGLPEEEVTRRTQAALAAVGLPADVASRSPFELSGGQMRRVAIAGVLALEPRYLVLDEPTAGLDPPGRESLLRHLREWHRRGRAVVLVTHRMEEAALAGRIVVLHDGRVVCDDPPRQVFVAGPEGLRAWGLVPPPVVRLMADLRRAGAAVSTGVLTPEEARDEILRAAGLSRVGGTDQCSPA